MRSKLNSALALLRDCETQAIADGTYKMPSKIWLSRELGASHMYFKDTTTPSRIAATELEAAQARLDQLFARHLENKRREKVKQAYAYHKQNETHQAIATYCPSQTMRRALK